MWSCDQSFVVLHFYERSYHNLNFIRIWPEKTLFWEVVLVQVQQFGTGTRYNLEILHQCGKKVKTKNQKFFTANSYVCRSYWRKTGREGPFCTKLKIINLKIMLLVEELFSLNNTQFNTNRWIYAARYAKWLASNDMQHSLCWKI